VDGQTYYYGDEVDTLSLREGKGAQDCLSACAAFLEEDLSKRCSFGKHVRFEASITGGSRLASPSIYSALLPPPLVLSLNNITHVIPIPLSGLPPAFCYASAGDIQRTEREGRSAPPPAATRQARNQATCN
jgi:hypothetical protein